jgi:hypothetical protein
VFATSCRGCHSLQGNERRRTPGGDLLGYTMSRSEMLAYVGEMPTRRPLNPAAVRAVSDYVLAAERGARAHRQ